MVSKKQAGGGSIRSVERAIDILMAMNRRPFSTLHDLHRDTGLPKPSIVRLLRTLEAKGLAMQSSSYGAYQLLSGVKSLASGFHHEPEIIEVAEDIMIDFTQREGWPLSMALFDLNAMTVRACTIRFTALSLEQSSLNRRLSLVTRALGRAYFAHSLPSERAILLSILKDSKDPEDAGAQNEEAIERMVEDVLQRGYATRDPLIDGRSSTIAVPIRQHSRVVATLGFTWITVAMSLQKAVDKYLPRLVDTAESISRMIESGNPASREQPRAQGRAIGPAAVLPCMSLNELPVMAGEMAGGRS
ncbi:DNA-binding transcriptional regulator [Sphingobium sp. SYK-6]|uniref:DNA-binding transcriptional regulator n=1 Tax=Sphingobium sp. (strain NBRC 103272 / SYK-6) TaxID=627192 RepID=UPI0003066E2C|nr:DNA-binding transcriptional regulator [Sphingobium sp. SYK-6]